MKKRIRIGYVARGVLVVASVGLLTNCLWELSSTKESQKLLDPLVAEAISLLKSNHINASNVDWSEMEFSLLKLKAPSSRDERHKHIQLAIDRLKEAHTVLLRPEDLDAVFQPNDALAHVRYAEQSIRVEKIDQFAYVAVPPFTVLDEQAGNVFATSLDARISAIETSNPKGWIVDLRGNTGGNMWPALAGLSCFFDESLLGEFRRPSIVFGRWWVRGKSAVLEFSDPLRESGGVVVTTLLEKSKTSGACLARTRKLPIVLLVDSETGSAGESLAISFLSRGVLAVVGEKTAGFATANALVALSDGSMLVLTVGSMFDRTGRSFPSGITPDKISKTSFWKVSRLERDDAIRQALELLSQ